MLIKVSSFREYRCFFLSQTASGKLEQMCDFSMDPLILKYRLKQLNNKYLRFEQIRNVVHLDCHAQIVDEAAARYIEGTALNCFQIIWRGVVSPAVNMTYDY
jgi:hypothetical protein